MKKAITLLFFLFFLASTSFAQNWYQYGFKLSTHFPLNREYTYVGDYMNASVNADFGIFFRAGRYVYGEIGVGYAFFKGDYSNENENFQMERMETRHLQIPVKVVGDIRLSNMSDILPFVGIVYQPTLKVTDNACNYSLKPQEGMKEVERHMVLLTAGFDLKLGPIVFGVNYRYALQTFFRNYDGKHPQYINLCAGFQL